NIRVLARTARDALSAFLRPEGHFRHHSPSVSLKNTPDDFCAPAWLCTQVNGGSFRGINATNPPKSTISGAAHADVTM
ncbi:hypothetical protein AB2526_24540, partial [Enterobacter hormaechei]|uniref:hypothetical protein n=1 Tax=Enterobacter hormaechei TaxID=158836 RepID=UPI003463A260